MLMMCIPDWRSKIVVVWAVEEVGPVVGLAAKATDNVVKDRMNIVKNIANYFNTIFSTILKVTIQA